ncbi:MAG: tRNA (adenosine(37)-N6)-threonylcarbamoyltransferase complex ATPase subunit type 1 TsaE [Deltaproteobacteria bacterium]|nr:tRNA (adenosine(37)-N6)-threonylcarbamoyltransferase complex ATPase subunit type 1 TsaE [Deltaproteobacteria bacterium]
MTIFTSHSPDDTIAIARELGSCLADGDLVALTGDLGAGKTLFCKGIGEALGIPPERITSPSFTIMTRHEGRLPLTHVDVYRLETVVDALEIGLDEMFAGEGVCVVEWAEKVTELLPTDCVRVTFTISDEDERLISVSAPDQPRFHGFLSRSQRFQPGG